MLCSVLIASRKRPDGLHKSIQSLYDTAKPENFEVLVRLDDDDDKTLDRLSEFEHYGNVRILIGPHLNGRESTGTFLNELARLASGDWIYITNDDMLMLGSGWDEQLKAVPKSGYVVHPEFYWLGDTLHGSGSCGVIAPFVPNKCWEQYGLSEIGGGGSADDWLTEFLVNTKGWQPWLLKGITCKHEALPTET